MKNKKLHILIVHNSYQQKGGEDVVVENEIRLLKKNGHKVSFYNVSNDNIRSSLDKVNVTINSTYNKGSASKFEKELLKRKPDIVHVHNFFPILTPSIYDICIKHKLPVIQTLHNYRTVCANGILLRDSVVCEKCLNGSSWWGAFHKCYRGSLIGSLAVSRMIAYHKRNSTWHKKVNKFISLTNFSKRKFVEAGFPEDKIEVKPNFIFDLDNKRDVTEKRGNNALFVGRISQEKGIENVSKMPPRRL